MKKSVIRWIVFAIVFLISLFVISKIMNQGNTDMTTEMKPPTYPLVYMNVNGERINCLHGYESEMEISYQRETITPIPNNRQVSIEIDKFGNEIEEIAFQVRNVNGKRLIEDTMVKDYVQQDDKITAEITIKDLIEENTEYSLTILIKVKGGKTIRFYTRIIHGENNYVNEKIAFVKDFHQKTFDKEQAKEIARYLESDAQGDNTTFHKVNIHSNFSQITWGDLAVEKIGETQMFIRELGTQTASVELNYFIEIHEGKEEKQYRVKEFYRVRYGSDRMYLLDYERTMSQLFNPQKHPFAKNKIELGIANPDVKMMESDGGTIVAYVNENSLYSYNAADHKFSCLFSFYDANNTDRRSTYNGNNIKILSVEETGNVRFMLYGYMNRGRHEGNVGVQIYYYNATLNTLEEEIFIPYTKTYEILESNVEQLSYVSKNNILYVMLDGNIYAVDLMNHSYEVIVSNVLEGSFKVSESGKMLVWQEGENSADSSKLTLMNFSTKKQRTIEAGSGQRIKPLGFMEEDLIFGLAYEGDVIKDKSGGTIFPMYQVKIESENGEVLKNYRQENVYVESCEVENNQIVLKRLQEAEDGNGYLSIEDDQIMNNTIEDSSVNKIETVVIDKYGKMVQIAVKATIPVKSLKYITPKEVLYEGERKLVLSNKEESIDRYYVYGKEGMEGSFTEAKKAIDLADQISGVVMNDEGEYVWVKGNRATRNQIMAITPQMISEEKGSLAVCLDTVLKYQGILRNSEYMLKQGESVLSILETNLENAQILDLSGCSLDSVLYYVNRDIPVISLLEDGNAVLIIGFNELNTVIMDPVTETLYKKGMNDSIQWFEENANTFITYIPQED